MASTNITVPRVTIHRAPSKSRRNATPSVSPRDYVGAINKHASNSREETLYPGQVYEDLSGYLGRASILRENGAPASPEPQCAKPHVSLHTLDKDVARAAETFIDAATCVKTLKSNTDDRRSQLVFVSGHICPNWLTTVAASLSVDPEFLNSNMLYRCRRKYSAYPPLPSAFENNIRLRLMTIGARENITVTSRSNPDRIERLRAKARTKMTAYRHELKMLRDEQCGISVVRDFHVVGERHFAIEQEISVSMHFREKSWSALVMSDVGENLSSGPQGPWQKESTKTELYPTIQHRKRIALRTDSSFQRRQSLIEDNFSQTASMLTREYGNLLVRSAICKDPFYALNDIFKLVAASENQLLNLLEKYIRYDAGHEALDNEQPTLSNLVYYQDILQSHLDYLKEIKDVVRRRGGLHWPRFKHEPAIRAITEPSAKSLLNDFEHLERRAQAISKRCKRGMDIIMNNRILAENRQAMSQAKRVTRLTFIAFIYIPLSFTTSFFGMNIQQLGTGGLPIWVWVATSVPVVAVTIFMFFSDIIFPGWSSFIIYMHRICKENATQVARLLWWFLTGARKKETKPGSIAMV